MTQRTSESRRAAFAAWRDRLTKPKPPAPAQEPKKKTTRAKSGD